MSDLDPSPSSFYDVRRLLDAGDNEGARVVFERFARQLIARARARLGTRMQTKVDPDDVVQSAFKSFFERYEAGQFELENWESLWGLLLQITMRKCNRWVERFGAQRRTLAAEAAVEPGSVWHPTSPEDSPSEIAVLNEMLDGLKAELGESDWEIVSLRLQEYPVAEIGERLQRSQRSVERILQHARRILSRQIGE